MAADQSDAEAGFVLAVIVVGHRADHCAGFPDDGGGEAVFTGGKGVGGESGLVQVAAAALTQVDLLEGENIGSKSSDGSRKSGRLDQPVGERPPVQQVEGGQAHRVSLEPWHGGPVVKVFVCSVLVFVAVGSLGLWLRQRRGR